MTMTNDDAFIESGKYTIEENFIIAWLCFSKKQILRGRRSRIRHWTGCCAFEFSSGLQSGQVGRCVFRRHRRNHEFLIVHIEIQPSGRFGVLRGQSVCHGGH